MFIGVDAREAVRCTSGKSVYTYQLLRELIRLSPEDQFLLYTRELTPQLAELADANVHIKIVRSGGLLWHWRVARDWKKWRKVSADVQTKCRMKSHAATFIVKQAHACFFAPTSFIIPAILPRNCTSVITVHDLVALLHPQLHQRKATIIEKLFLGVAARKARAILVPSENTKKDLMRIMNIREEKIHVAQLGVESPIGESESSAEDLIKKISVPQKFILTVGGLEPRKNIRGLVDAMPLVREKYPDMKVVIVGGAGWRSHETQKVISQHADAVVQLSNVSTADIAALYKRATVFVFPSWHEGFGLPPLEAMAHGCPVVCSNASSLPEVCGDAAVYVSPEDPTDIARGILQVLDSPELQNKLRAAGLAQSKKFTWQKTAELTRTVIAGQIPKL